MPIRDPLEGPGIFYYLYLSSKSRLPVRSFLCMRYIHKSVYVSIAHSTDKHVIYGHMVDFNLLVTVS